MYGNVYTESGASGRLVRGWGRSVLSSAARARVDLTDAHLPPHRLFTLGQIRQARIATTVLDPLHFRLAIKLRVLLSVTILALISWLDWRIGRLRS